MSKIPKDHIGLYLYACEPFYHSAQEIPKDHSGVYACKPFNHGVQETLKPKK